MMQTATSKCGLNCSLADQAYRSRSSRLRSEHNELGKNQMPFLGGKEAKGIVWQRRDGLPILGSRRVRQVVLAAAFPEFFTTQEVDALHTLLDEESSEKYRFFGETNPVPDQNKLMWRFGAGHFESTRWAGSRPKDPLGVSPWWAGGIIYGLLNEMPREYDKHARAYVEVGWVVKIMTGGEEAPKFVRP
ncbi:hypothetical protein BT69DRAFT_1291226 [Atractiella rhizophila]|nr:hypothetical protein BT69DRAFT_1291226 [Atractiella rhizophila]